MQYNYCSLPLMRRAVTTEQYEDEGQAWDEVDNSASVFTDARKSYMTSEELAMDVAGWIAWDVTNSRLVKQWYWPGPGEVCSSAVAQKLELIRCDNAQIFMVMLM